MCGAAWRSLNRTESPHFRQYGKKEFRNKSSDVRGSSEWQISYMPDCSTGSPGTRVQSDCSKLLRNGCWCCMGYCGLLRRFSSIGFSTETSGYGWIQMPLFLLSPTGRHATGCGASSRPLCFDALKIMQVGERRVRDNTPKKLIAGGLSCRFLYFRCNPARVPNADGLT